MMIVGLIFIVREFDVGSEKSTLVPMDILFLFQYTASLQINESPDKFLYPNNTRVIKHYALITKGKLGRTNVLPLFQCTVLMQTNDNPDEFFLVIESDDALFPYRKNKFSPRCLT